MTEDIQDKIQDWPPAYSVRRSERACKVLLKIKPLRGLEIVIPAYRKRFNVQAILEENRSWIEKTFKRVLLHDRIVTPILTTTKPHALECSAIDERWTIHYEHRSYQKNIRLKPLETEKQLIITDPEQTINNVEQYKYLLKRWLIKYAHQHLVPWIVELSALTGLVFQQIKIRGQSTLWGSCNIKKVISLNYKLLFLPKTLVRHVLLHELCHVQYLNHSEAFWNLLEKWDPEYRSHKKALKLADNYLPCWIT